MSVEALPHVPTGICAVAETRFGILEYSHEQPTVAQSIRVYGEYLQQQLDLLARLVRPGAVVLEAGAGIGAHALFLAEAVGPAGHLYLYEPRTTLQQILRQNLAANGVTNVTVMRRRLGSPAAADAGQGDTPQTTADPFARVETIDELRLPRLDWLKISEPGQALDILEGAAETLWRLRPLLFIAVRDEDEIAAGSGRLQHFGYRTWRMDAALFNADSFNRFDRDVFGNAAALALVGIPEEIEVDITLDRCQELHPA
jgi:FkbM family methyltransferase